MASTAAATEKWKESSIRTIKVAQTLVAKTENDIDEAVAKDPLPTLRDRCVRETNRRIQEYARSVRAVVVQLRQAFVAVNDEIKSLNRTKEALVRFLNATRRLLTINHQTILTRQEKPIREKKLPDSADDSIAVENEQLLIHKQQIESQMHTVLATLQSLGNIRANLAAIIQERSRATELISHSVSYDSRRRTSSRQQSIIGVGGKRHVKSYSAPPSKTQEDLSVKASTPAVVDATFDANKVIGESQTLRADSSALMDDLNKKQNLLRETVNEHVVQKIAQTATLNQHLTVNAGETGITMLTSQRLLHNQQKSLGYSLGPVSSRDITVREKLDRPLVRVYQTHPGTDLPEAIHLINDADNRLAESISVTQRNIALLKLARKKLKDDSRDKKIGINVDSSILRMRKREGENKRMLLLAAGTAMTLIKPPTVSCLAK